MKQWLSSLLYSPEDADASYVRLLRIILFSATIGILIIIIGLVITQPEDFTAIYILGGLWLIFVASLIFSLRNIYWPGKLIIPLAGLVGVTAMASLANGMHDTSMVGFTAIIVIGGLLIGKQAVPLLTVLTLVGISIVTYRDMSGLNPSFMAVKTGIDDLLVFSVIQITVASSLNALMSRLTTSLQKSQENEKMQITINTELRELQESLEDQVAQRTLELEQRSHELSDRTVQLEIANIRTQRRAAQLQAISDTTKAIATARNLQDLLPRIVNVVCERFGFYHVGIFLTDEANQYAILSAANSEGGKQMLARGHRLEVGTQGIVGYVTGSGNPRIALDTGADAAYFNNPDLPETHSEMAVPLVSDKRIIGALDVQSTQSNAFAEEDIEVISTLADQVSIAIETARLFESSQKAFSEVETIYRQYLQREWSRLSASEEIIGYQHTVAGAQPLQARVTAKEISQALSSGEVATATGEEATLTVPIKVRGEAIGVLNIRVPQKSLWKQDEIAIAQAIADRVAISAENARLFQESQSRAEKERAISQISEKLSSSVNLENIFRTALQELGQLVPGSEVFVEFETGQET
jgi:GAF domain-containing protein